jgi:hypothetical protein
MTQQILNALGSFLRYLLDGEGLSFKLLGNGLAFQIVVQDFGAGCLGLSYVLETNMESISAE